MRRFGMSVLTGGVMLCTTLASASWREELPKPVFDEEPGLVDFYYKAWEIAHTRIDNLPGMPVPRYMDEAHMASRIWIWDTCLMAHFCKYAFSEFPGIESLGNFYSIMFRDKQVPLPKVRGNKCDGKNEGKLLDLKIHHVDNPPLFAWTEYAYALQTGDRSRLESIYIRDRYLQRWYELFESFDPKAPQPYGTDIPVKAQKTSDGYHWGCYQSGMDNSPRGRKGDYFGAEENVAPENPDLLWVDALAQQGLSALYIARIAELLGRAGEAAEWRAKYEVAKAKINGLYWNDGDGLYYDILASDRSQVKVKTIAAFWPMLAEMPTRAMADRLEAHLTDERTFGGECPANSLSRDDKDFWPRGGYWRGSVWIPTAYMAVKAVDAYGDYALAREIARKIVLHTYRTYADFSPHSIWECYSPTACEPSRHVLRDRICHEEFCGWSALAPISLLIEDVIGIRQANAFAKTLVCDFARNPVGRVGVRNYVFGAVKCDILATADEITVDSSAPFSLRVDGRSFEVKAGHNVIGRKKGK